MHFAFVLAAVLHVWRYPDGVLRRGQVGDAVDGDFHDARQRKIQFRPRRAVALHAGMRREVQDAAGQRIGQVAGQDGRGISQFHVGSSAYTGPLSLSARLVHDARHPPHSRPLSLVPLAGGPDLVGQHDRDQDGRRRDFARRHRLLPLGDRRRRADAVRPAGRVGAAPPDRAVPAQVRGAGRARDGAVPGAGLRGGLQHHGDQYGHYHGHDPAADHRGGRSGAAPAAHADGNAGRPGVAGGAGAADRRRRPVAPAVGRREPGRSADGPGRAGLCAVRRAAAPLGPAGGTVAVAVRAGGIRCAVPAAGLPDGRAVPAERRQRAAGAVRGDLPVPVCALPVDAGRQAPGPQPGQHLPESDAGGHRGDRRGIPGRKASRLPYRGRRNGAGRGDAGANAHAPPGPAHRQSGGLNAFGGS
ncbi:hypothetical protein G6F57_015540 [Rhizopus arrhizus]|nr:hypothetical protein G6F57_015540 [Rhizopus arrhizus]